MTEFLVEAYVSGEGENAEVLRIDVAGTADASQPGAEVRIAWAIFVPEDQACFYLYGSSSATRSAQRPACPLAV
jgi:hypothetical protein